MRSRAFGTTPNDRTTPPTPPMMAPALVRVKDVVRRRDTLPSTPCLFGAEARVPDLVGWTNDYEDGFRCILFQESGGKRPP
jgi:hypothetical protein